MRRRWALDIARSSHPRPRAGRRSGTRTCLGATTAALPPTVAGLAQAEMELSAAMVRELLWDHHSDLADPHPRRTDNSGRQWVRPRADDGSSIEFMRVLTEGLRRLET